MTTPRRRIYVSKYMELKAQAERLLAEAEEVRRVEFDDEVADIRKRCIAWGITAADLFPHEPNRTAARAMRRDSGRAPVNPARYRLDGVEWAGKGGPKPHVIAAFLASGGKLDAIAIEADGRTPKERSNGA
jgi:DNA-binding protein H-NS